MPANYVLIEKISVGAATASSVTFSGIPQTGYTDLVVKASVNGSGNYNFLMSINGSSSTFSYRLLEGDGSTAASYNNTTGRIGAVINATANTFSSVEVYIPNYTSSNNKSYSVDAVTEANQAQSYQDLTAGLWSTTSAITSLGFNLATGNFAQYSTFYLYGVAKLGTTPVIVPYATGGDTIMTDGTYWYHAFLASGTFTPAKGLSCDVLVVAGGGGGSSGAGGAGGLLGYSAQTAVSATTITVGAGGTGVNMGTHGLRGSSGSNSQFAALTASVGGGGGGGLVSNVNGINGGSGGGGGASSSGGGSGGTATSGQGYAGGTASMISSNYGSGGGGGGGGVGGNSTTLGTSDTAGAGGVGLSTYSSWGSVTQTGQNVSGTYFYAGGGGGAIYGAGGSPTPGTGGNGGGGAGGNVAAGTSATANTGGGGGGAGGSNLGGNGGSGIVIVRYAV